MAYIPPNINGQATMANSEPVVIASDQSAIPISSATLATSAKQDLLLTELQLKADLSETQPVSIAVVPSHAVTNVGTFAVQESGAALTALQLLDDTVTTLGTDTYTEATSKGVTLGAVRRDADTTLVSLTNEFTPLQVDANGRLKVEAFSGETLPVSLTSTTVTGTVTVDSELPTAAALADNTATPTAPAVGAFGMVWDGATWDRAAGNSTDGTLVNLGANNDVTVTSGTITAVTGITNALPAGTNNIGDVDVLTVNGVAPAFNTGVRGATVQRVTIATDDIVPASQSGTWTVQPGNTANSTAWLVSDRPATTGGLSKFHLVSAATTNATNVKASAGQVYGITAFNINASPRYIKFHNTAGTPTAGTAVTDSFLIPGNTSGAGMVINFDKGIAFSTGIGITTVTEMADAGTTAIAANEMLINIYYS